ncbi:MAG TPA: ABC transporter permease [Verrucomicrobiae bacterium]
MRVFSEIYEGLRISLAALRANKMRSALATIGIVIGVVTVTLMNTAINGINEAFKQNIAALGSDVLFVQRWPWMMNSHEEWVKVSRRKEVTWQQYETVAREMTLAKAIAPGAGVDRPVKYKNRQSNSVGIIGSNEQSDQTMSLTVREGRYLTAAESEGGRPIAVLGYQVATNLFIGESPLGKKIKAGGQTLEVVGVLEPKGTFLGEFSWDNRIVVPVRFLANAYRFRNDYEIQVKAISQEKLKEAEEELRGIMRRARRLRPGEADDFAINQQEMFLTTFNRVAGMIAAGGIFITSLSLFVGGIGIMNIMFVSVAERTREIGIRKAIGAKRRAILLQFLSEAAGICLLGGLLGLGIATGAMYGIRKFIPATMSLNIILIAIGVSVVTGLVSGFLPAWRAARMNPVDALRAE